MDGWMEIKAQREREREEREGERERGRGKALKWIRVWRFRV
jgi:hypothetical protein